MLTRAVAVVLALVLAACGGGDGSRQAATTTTTTAPTTHLSVRVTALRIGLGCVNTAPISGTQSRVTARDEHGTVIGAGEFALTVGAESCDWTAALELAESPEFLTLEGDQGPLTTLSRSDYDDGTVTLKGNADGHVGVVD